MAINDLGQDRRVLLLPAPTNDQGPTASSTRGGSFTNLGRAGRIRRGTYGGCPGRC